MKKLITICIAIFSLSLYAQQKSTSISNYQLSSSANGPTNTTVKLKYWVSNSFGSILLHLESECLPNLSYQYNGRVWTTEGIANAALNIKARNPIIMITVNGPNNFQKVLKVFIHNSGSQIDLGMASKDENKVPENYTVSIQKIDNVSFDNVREVEEIIKSKLLLADKDLKINQLLKDGDIAFDRKDLIIAESKFRELLKLDSSNERAIMRLKQIQSLQKTESSKKQFDEAIAAAKLEESQEHFDEAKSLYESALATGIDNSASSNGVNRVKRKIQEKTNSALEKAKAIEEKSN